MGLISTPHTLPPKEQLNQLDHTQIIRETIQCSASEEYRYYCVPVTCEPTSAWRTRPQSQFFLSVGHISPTPPNFAPVQALGVNQYLQASPVVELVLAVG